MSPMMWTRLKRWWSGEPTKKETSPSPSPSPAVSEIPEIPEVPEHTVQIAEEDVEAEELIIAEAVISFDDKELAFIENITPRLRERSLAELPPPTAFPDRAARALSRRNFDFDELVTLGHTDVAIAAALLRISNSTLFAGGMPVEDIRGAVGRLGTTMSTNVVSGIAAQSLFDVETRAEQGVFAEAFKDLFRQSMTVALVATRLSDRLRMQKASAVFSAGLFHDIGKVVALRALAKLVLSGDASDTLSQNVVVRLVEDVHVDVGVAMMKKWGLPNALVELCAHHHDPEEAKEADRRIVHLIRLVSGLNALRVDRLRNGSVVPEIQESAETLHLAPAELTDIFGDLRRTAEQLQSMF